MIADDKPLSRCTCSALRMMSRHLSQIYDQALAPTGLRSGQFALLRTLARIGPVGVQQLGEAMILDRTTVGRNVRPLERDGLVAVTVDPLDRRARRLTLTALGRERLAASEPLWTAAQERLESSFGAGPTRALHQAFASILALSRPV